MLSNKWQIAGAQVEKEKWQRQTSIWNIEPGYRTWAQCLGVQYNIPHTILKSFRDSQLSKDAYIQ